MCAQNVVLSEFRIKLHLGQDIYSILTLYRDIIPTISGVWFIMFISIKSTYHKMKVNHFSIRLKAAKQKSATI